MRRVDEEGRGVIVFVGQPDGGERFEDVDRAWRAHWRDHAATIIAVEHRVGETGPASEVVGMSLEVRKVVWPTRAETLQTTLAVLLMVLLVGIFLWLLDMFLLWAIQILTGQGS